MSHVLNTPLLIHLACASDNPILLQQAGRHRSFMCSVIFLKSWHATSVNFHLSQSLLICETLFTTQCDVQKLPMCFFYHLPVAVCNPVLLIPVLSVPAAHRDISTRALSEHSTLKCENPCLQRKECYAWAPMPANICSGLWVPAGCYRSGLKQGESVEMHQH